MVWQKNIASCNEGIQREMHRQLIESLSEKKERKKVNDIFRATSKLSKKVFLNWFFASSYILSLSLFSLCMYIDILVTLRQARGANGIISRAVKLSFGYQRDTTPSSSTLPPSLRADKGALGNLAQWNANIAPCPKVVVEYNGPDERTNSHPRATKQPSAIVAQSIMESRPRRRLSRPGPQRQSE